MDDDAWPETVNGWELFRSGPIENYRRRLANQVTVTARWENGRGTVSAHVETFALGRELTRSRTEFTDKDAFWTAARCVLDMAANLPSLGAGHESPAESVLCGEVAGHVEAEPGTNGTPEAELTFTLTDGRSVTLIMSDEQADDLTSAIWRLDKHVWSEQRDEDEDEDYEDEDDVVVDPADVPEVGDVRSTPDTGHDVATVLESQFGVTEDFLMAHLDFSAMIVVGEPAVSTLIARGAELTSALAPRWYPVVANRPGEQWVVLRRTGVFYGDE
ncbi:hypothetical protein [Amycolatopsis acidicola]|uniref:hypothetical protein n=1 Tax=Amycolatopsis acidicola TaxID=2596893 RepID=UPI001FB802CB|nr:hypothetical protein [Amycolatopsis acidicola]